MHFLLKKVYLKKEESKLAGAFEWLLFTAHSMLLVDLPLQVTVWSVICALKAQQLSKKASILKLNSRN